MQPSSWFTFTEAGSKVNRCMTFLAVAGRFLLHRRHQRDRSSTHVPVRKTYIPCGSLSESETRMSPMFLAFH